MSSSSMGEEPDPAPRRIATWKVLAGFAGVLGLVFAGSLIGSAHEKAAGRPGVAPTVTATESVVRTEPAVTLTATPLVTVTEAPTMELNPLPLIAHGTGSKRTASFRADSVSFQAVYTYDCPESTAPGFVANLYRNGDDVGPIADSRRASAGGQAYLDNGVGTFYVVVKTRCTWTVVITQGIFLGY